MKKNIIYYIFGILVLFYSCSESEVVDVFDKSPEERTSQVIKKIEEDLKASPNGWLAEYYYADSLIHTTLLFKFKDNNRVEIYSVFDKYLKKESGYRLNYAQQVDLVLETYSVMSLLVDATRAADFRWELQSSEEGKEYKFVSRTIRNKETSFLTLKKAEGNAEAYMANQRKIHLVKQKLVNDSKKSYFRNLRIKPSNKGYKYEFNLYKDEIAFTGLFDGKIKRFKTKVVISPDGKIKLNEPLNIDGAFIREFTYDDVLDVLNITDSDNLSGAVVYDNAPAVELPGRADYLLKHDFHVIDSYSIKALEFQKALKGAIPNLRSIQMYMKRGYFLAYTNPPHDGKVRHGGFAKIKYTKVAEDRIVAGIGGLRFYSWFQQIFIDRSDIRDWFVAYIFDAEGFYVDVTPENKIFLISKKDATFYFNIRRVN